MRVVGQISLSVLAFVGLMLLSGILERTAGREVMYAIYEISVTGMVLFILYVWIWDR